MSQQTKLNVMQVLRKELPVFEYKQELIRKIQDHDTLIVSGETASGKTTQIPQFVLDNYINRGKPVAITQPRRVAAISLATRVAQERGEAVGETVGYTVRFQQCTSDSTKLTYMTDGLLLREALTDPLLSRYSVIILDEIHERSLNTDMLLGVLKYAQSCRNETKKKKKKNSLKLILMSATMESDLLQDYFDESAYVYVKGRVHDIKTFNIAADGGDYVSAMVCQVIKLHDETTLDHHILIFLPGQDEINGIISVLKSYKLKNLELFPLYSALSYEAQLKAISQPKPGVRRVVVSTNIAETSLTIPGIRIVFDCGYVNRKVNLSLGYEALQINKTSQAECYQRSGRAGREYPGICYRFFTNDDFELRASFPEPEIQRSNISGVILQVVKLGFVQPSTFAWLEPPPEQAICQAVRSLKKLYAIEGEKEPLKLTKIGLELSNIPLTPQLAKVLFMAPDYCLSDPVATILGVLSSEPIMNKCTAAVEFARSEKFYSQDGDLITYLLIMQKFRQAKSKIEFCKQYKFNLRALKFANKVRQQLLTYCKDSSVRGPYRKVDEPSVSEDLRSLFLIVFPTNTAVYENTSESGGGVYRTLREGGQTVEVKIHPSSTMAGKRFRTLHFLDITQLSMGKNYISHVSPMGKELKNQFR